MDTRRCQECRAEIPATPGYPEWCDECGWNLKPPPAHEEDRGRFAQLARALGRRGGDRLARELLEARALKPRWTPARIAAYAIAIAVHLFTLALIVAGIAAILSDFPNVLAILIGATLLGLGLVMRPRLGKPPERGHVVDAPALREVTANVAQALGGRPPDEIRIDGRWNASWQAVGVPRRRILTLGLPLLAALEAQERVALIGHELGHGRNGDSRRSVIVGSAVNGLDWLADALRHGVSYADADIGWIDWVSGGLMWLVSRPVDALLWLEAHLLLRDVQRAEYLADALAARAAGSGAAIALHERLLLYSTFQLVVQQAAHENAENVLDRLRISIQLIPDRERERRRRVARLEEARLDDTHPPTGMRIALLEQRAAEPPRVVLNEAQSRRIDAELETLVHRIDREMLDTYRDSLYYG